MKTLFSIFVFVIPLFSNSQVLESNEPSALEVARYRQQQEQRMAREYQYNDGSDDDNYTRTPSPASPTKGFCWFDDVMDKSWGMSITVFRDAALEPMGSVGDGYFVYLLPDVSTGPIDQFMVFKDDKLATFVVTYYDKDEFGFVKSRCMAAYGRPIRSGRDRDLNLEVIWASGYSLITLICNDDSFSIRYEPNE